MVELALRVLLELILFGLYNLQFSAFKFGGVRRLSARERLVQVLALISGLLLESFS